MADVEPWHPVLWTGCCDLVTGANYDQLDALLGDFRTLPGLLRRDLEAHRSATGQDLFFSATVSWWLHDESAVPGRVPNGDSSTLASHLDGLVDLVFGGWGSNEVDVVTGSNDVVLEAPTAIAIVTGNLSWEERARMRAELDLLYAGVASYRGSVTFHFATLEEQYLARP